MMKSDKRTVIFTSLLCLLPMVFSVVVYQSLPAQIAIHWNIEGVPDNYASRAVAAFGLPVLFLVIHLFTVLLLLNDPKREVGPQTLRLLGIWIIPGLSVVLIPVTLLIAMGTNIPIAMLVTLMVGVLLVVIGNYLPKSRQNYTVGIKLPWTLSSEDNWNKTHRFAGYLWVLGGLLMIVGSFLLHNDAANFSLIIGIVAVLAIFPAVYSFFLYHRRNGKI